MITDAANKQPCSENRSGSSGCDNVALAKTTDQTTNTDELSASGEDVEGPAPVRTKRKKTMTETSAMEKLIEIETQRFQLERERLELEKERLTVEKKRLKVEEE